GAPPEAGLEKPQALLLDGQQRMTSLYQVTLRGKVVETVTPRKKLVKRWFYMDMEKALDPSVEREEAVIALPENKVLAEDFGRRILHDASTRQKEYEGLLYPLAAVFDWDNWQKGFISFSMARGDFEEKWKVISAFK